MFVLSIVFVTSALLYTCDASFVDTLHKCSIKDNLCLKNLYGEVIRNNSDGIPEFDIPKLDPMALQNITIPVLDTIKFTLLNGSAKGISKCIFNLFEINVEKSFGTQKITCDLTIKGHVAVSGNSPLVQGLTGNPTIDTTAKTKVKLENVKIGFTFLFSIVKKEDGETYISVPYKDIKYDYDIEKAAFAADKIIIGNNDIAPVIIPYLNENWKIILKTTGQKFIDKACEIYFEIAQKFFANCPTKYYILEDLTPYI